MVQPGIHAAAYSVGSAQKLSRAPIYITFGALMVACGGAFTFVAGLSGSGLFIVILPVLFLWMAAVCFMRAGSKATCSACRKEISSQATQCAHCHSVFQVA